MYKLGPTNELTNQTMCIFNTEKNISIPLDPSNTDYQEYLKWLAKGNTPEGAE